MNELERTAKEYTVVRSVKIKITTLGHNRIFFKSEIKTDKHLNDMPANFDAEHFRRTFPRMELNRPCHRDVFCLLVVNNCK
jgi:hypothetical protein